MAKIVAVGLLTQRDLDILGAGFTRLWPVDETPCFHDLLQAIDKADQELKRGRERTATTIDTPRPGPSRTRS